MRASPTALAKSKSMRRRTGPATCLPPPDIPTRCQQRLGGGHRGEQRCRCALCLSGDPQSASRATGGVGLGWVVEGGGNCEEETSYPVAAHAMCRARIVCGHFQQPTSSTVLGVAASAAAVTAAGASSVFAALQRPLRRNVVSATARCGSRRHVQASHRPPGQCTTGRPSSAAIQSPRHSEKNVSKVGHNPTTTTATNSNDG